MNNCKYLKIKFNKKFECKKLNKLINIKECNYCEHKTKKYPIYKKNCAKTIKNKSTLHNKRTKAVAISKKVKLIVWERDNHKCIFCHCEVPWNLANSHFIKRSHGGLGIPENIFCACLKCHNKFDDSLNRRWMLPIAEKHLKSKYDHWNKDDLIYKKY